MSQLPSPEQPILHGPPLQVTEVHDAATLQSMSQAPSHATLLHASSAFAPHPILHGADWQVKSALHEGPPVQWKAHVPVPHVKDGLGPPTGGLHERSPEHVTSQPFAAEQSTPPAHESGALQSTSQSMPAGH